MSPQGRWWCCWTDPQPSSPTSGSPRALGGGADSRWEFDFSICTVSEVFRGALLRGKRQLQPPVCTWEHVPAPAFPPARLLASKSWPQSWETQENSDLIPCRARPCAHDGSRGQWLGTLCQGPNRPAPGAALSCARSWARRGAESAPRAGSRDSVPLPSRVRLREVSAGSRRAAQ